MTQDENARGARFHVMMIAFWSVLVMFAVGMLIATVRADLDYSFLQWLVVSLITVSCAAGLAWQVRSLIALQRSGRKSNRP